MVFSSNVFLLFFLPIATILYYVILSVSKKNLNIANIWLLVLSLFFYSYGEPVYVFVMIGSIVVNYAVGKLILKTEKDAYKKAVLAVGIILNIANLFVFKYLQWVTGKKLGIRLPIGISFYTFQAMSYIIDVYRNPYSRKQTSLINIGLYISFFPQLIAGPIVRFTTVADQINKRKHSIEKFSEGFWRFSEGLAKKVLIANQLAPYAEIAFKNAASQTVVFAWFGAVAAVLQIYFDFSGYSDMAIGLGRMFGFEFNENFNYPFMSKSITEYWRRWHISLGEWFRDYLFYPLSLGPAVKLRKKLSNKMSVAAASEIASVFVLFTVWLATGIWHGANMTFVVWGILQFSVILLEKHIKPKKGWCHVRTVLLCIIFAVMFNAESLSHAGSYYLSMFGLSGQKFIDGITLYWLGQYGLLITAGIILSFPVVPFVNKIAAKKKTTGNAWNIAKFAIMVFFFASSVSYTVGSGYNPFIYFNF